MITKALADKFNARNTADDNTRGFCHSYWSGLFTRDECLSILDKYQVRGSLTCLTFTGYDYAHQHWIEVRRHD